MSDLRTQAIQYAHKHHEAFLEKMVDFIRIPTISTSSEHIKDMHRAADWLVAYFKKIGVENAEVFKTKKHPIVYAEYLSDKKAPTVLIYGHYDVQPPEPLEQWESEPFEPVIRDQNLYGRGSSDMKGQIFATLAGVEAILKQGYSPVNIKFFIEGEEEIGSPSLKDFLIDNRDLLACDIVLNLDAGMIAADIPTITYGLRGIASFELKIYGPKHDIHSGLFGGIVDNPAHVLCALIAGMHDEQGRVMLPGYYDSVRSLSEEERQELSRLPMDEEYFLEQTGVHQLWGENEFTPIERIGARPTLEVNGLYSGYIGEGGKTIIPSYSMAKITTRLVPDQDPEKVHQQLKAYLEAKAPKTVQWDLNYMAGAPACITDLQLPETQAFYEALKTVWGIKPVYNRIGGSIPVATEMQQFLGADSILSGFGLPDDNVHAPNEKLHLPTWYRGIDATIHFLCNMKKDR